MDALEKLQDVARNPSQVAQSWKAKGGKVVGYRCLYIPEEIIWAADMLPYPIYGTPDPVGLADSYFQPSTCEFVRNIFDHALEGDLDFLDYLALSNTCDVVRRLADIWAGYIKKIPVYLLNNPQKLLTATNRDYFTEELFRFKREMEELSGSEIRDDKLREAIVLHNETRALLKQLNAQREDDQPRISGPEMLDVCMAASVLPANEANELIKQLLGELEDREVEENFGPRIMVTGSILDHPALIQMIEDEGGLVVADDLCTTSRYFWHLVDEKGAPMESLYNFLNNRPLCACMHPVGARIEHLLSMANQFDAEAVINFNLKFCHPFLYEAPLIKKVFEKRNIPTAMLEVGHDLSGHGQLRTRIQAFIEMIEL